MRTILLLAFLATICCAAPACLPEFDYERDADGDGAPDWVEAVAGTDRDDPASVPEDTDGNGVYDGFQGTMGKMGTMGDPGVAGVACWDLDKDGEADTLGEDVNGDGSVDVDDCAGAAGRDGLGCWDLNADGLGDPATEDTNGDGTVDVLDCAGAAGLNGTPGVDGSDGMDGIDGIDGLSCWDLNGNGTADPATEDANGDGSVDVLDCLGAPGPSLSKADIYVSTTMGGGGLPGITTFCADAGDVLFGGGCECVGMGCATSFVLVDTYPVAADDPAQISGWHCVHGGSVLAHAICKTVP